MRPISHNWLRLTDSLKKINLQTKVYVLDKVIGVLIIKYYNSFLHFQHLREETGQHVGIKFNEDTDRDKMKEKNSEEFCSEEF